MIFIAPQSLIVVVTCLPPVAPQREAASGVGRLKWDAKVRMKQAKLRAAGENMDRQEVVEILIEENAQAAQDGVVERFHEIALERGFDDGEVGEKQSTRVIVTVKKPKA